MTLRSSAALALALCAGAGCAKEARSDAEARWGIEVLSVRRTAAEKLLDVRYRVVDADKAAALLDRANKPALIDEASGARFGVPFASKIGNLRSTTKTPEANRNYFVLFGNPGGAVKAGSKVTVKIGDFEAKHLVVE